MSILGANHNWFNTVWFADRATTPGGTDAAVRHVSQPNNIRLSGGDVHRVTRAAPATRR